MKRVPGLDLLRAFAIVWVMFFHAWMLDLGTPWLDGSRFGWMGVDLFFALSGYLIGKQWFLPLRDGNASFGDFYVRRAFRILPAFLVILAIYFLFPQLREKPAIQPLWQFLTFTENLLFEATGPKAFSHVWSLCVEEHFYVAFPLLALFLSRRSLRLTVVVCLSVFVFGLVYRAGTWFGVVEGATREGWIFFELIYYPTFGRLDGLLAGVVLAMVEVYRRRWWTEVMHHSRWLLVAGLVLVAFAIWLFDGDRTASSTVFGYPILSLGMALLVGAAADPDSVVQRVPMPGVSAIATLSYSLYLSHKLAFSAVSAAGFLPIAAGSLLAAAALHFAVERPFLKLRASALARSGVSALERRPLP